ncbi:AzlC family ABC transporter permease [Planctomycetes bacterium K23_9]|uniref:Uncharacterized protein n=1 Tax=Stieleria marina TaxID=1930275 RepID=A0A517NU74_9BACT|nr:hypothetical protein K239x_26360 [Planctomycetes bacterium K23_9]
MPPTLQCPRCNQTVTIGAESAGMRVKCPHCEKLFLAPGFSASTNDDDDWLSLDTDGASVASSPTIASRDDPASDAPTLDDSQSFDSEELDDVEVVEDDEPNVDEPNVLAKFGDELSAFTSSIEPLPSATANSGNQLGDAGDSFDALPPFSDAETPAQATAAGKAPASNAAGKTPSLNESVDDDDEFKIPDLPLPVRVPLQETLPTADLADTPPAGRGQTDAGKPRQADAVEYESEYRVKCNICGSILYAKAAQAGKSIKCTDCHSPVKVPPPPRVKKKLTIDVENAKTFGFEDSAAHKKKRVDPYQKSAQDLLDEAERDEDKTPTTFQDPDIPSLREWATNVFGIFLDFGVIARWLCLSMMGAIPAAIVISIGHPLLVVGLMVWGVVFTALTVACGFAIMLSVANEHETVTDWPEADPTAWIDDLVVALSAVILAGVPILAITSLAFGPGLLSTAMTMFSIYLLFPFFVLSMMDMQSIFMPFSPEVARSVTRCQEAWGGLYFSAGLLFAVLFFFFVGLSSAAPVAAAVIAVFASVAVAFCYFSMIGRLAFAIGQSVNEPAKNKPDSAAETTAK